MTVHRVWLKLHLWAGLSGAAFIFVMAATGSALVFENEIDRALNPATSYVTPGRDVLPLSRLIAGANSAQPDDPVASIRIGERPDLAYELAARRRHSIFVTRYSGDVLGTRDREKSFARFVHLLHTRFDAGDRRAHRRHIHGRHAVPVYLGCHSLVAAQDAAHPDGGSWKRANVDLHNVLGFYSSIVMFVIALAGVSIAFERITDPLVLRLNAAPETNTAGLQSIPEPGVGRISPDEAVAVSTALLPGAFASNVILPGGPKGIYRVLLKFPEDRTPAGRSRVYLDQYTGTVIGVENTRTAQRGRRLLNLKRSLHTGDVFGAPTQVLYFLVSLGLTLQVASGVLIWWNSR